MESAIYKSEFESAVCAYVDLPAREENTKENDDKSILDLFWECLCDAMGVTSRTFWSPIAGNRQAITGENLNRPLAIRCKEMQTDLKSIQALTRIKIGHVFLRKETWNAERVKLCLGNVCLNGIVKMLQYNNIFISLLHATRKFNRQRFELDKKLESTTFADQER